MIAIHNNILQIPHSLIQSLHNDQETVIVVSVVSKSQKSLEKALNQLLNNTVNQVQGLFLMQQERFLIFGVSVDQEKNIVPILQLLYYVSAYQYFVCDSDNELEELYKLYSKIPSFTWHKLFTYSPKVNEKQLKHSLFRVTKKYLILKGKPKLINEQYNMSASMFIDMLLHFSDAYNNSQSLLDVFYNTFKCEYLKRLEKVKMEYSNGIQQLRQLCQSEKILMESDELDIRHRELLFKILYQIEDLHPQQSTSVKHFFQKIAEDYESIVAQNFSESREYCSSLMNSFLKIFQEETDEDIIQQKEIFIQLKGGQFEEILETYLKDSVGPYKYRTVAEFVPQLLFQQFDKWFEKINSHYLSELNANKAHLMQTIENLEEYKNRLSDVESKKFDMENQNQTLFFEVETQKREVEKLTKLKELQEELNDRQLNELKQKHENAKQKKKLYKEKYEQVQEDYRKCNMELNEKKKELINHLMKIQHLENALNQTISKGDNAQTLQKELIQLMNHFKENLLQAESQMISRSSVASESSRVSERFQLKQLDKVYSKYEKSKERCKLLEGQLNKSNQLIDDLSKQATDKDQQIQKLQQEIELMKKLDDETQEQIQKDQQDRLAQTNRQNEEFLKVLMHHKDQIEKANQEKNDIQNMYYEKSAKFVEMNYYKETLLTILREALKQTQRKQNTLSTILKSMPLEKQLEIKEIFTQAGIKL